MKNLRALFIALALIICSLLLAGAAYANQYEPEVTPVNILIDKKVSIPENNIIRAEDAIYVDNLFDFNKRFKPGQDVFFKLRVKNTSNIKLTNVQVKDFFPSGFVETIGGSGTLDRNSNPLAVVINVGDLNPDEERVFFIQTRALAQDRLPNDRSVFCGSQGVVNKAQATADRGAFDDDTAQFCIEKQVLAEQVPLQETKKALIVPSKIPSTGPELNLLLLSGEIFTLGLGLYLKKKAS